MQIDAADWQRVSRLLDQALDLERASRTQWLESLDPAHADLREILRELLTSGEAIKAAGFMHRLPEFRQAEAHVIAGEIVGRYRLIRELGTGGMATVWLAELTDGSLQRKVALKLPRTEWLDPGFIARMARERDILAALEHPHIARLYDAGIDAKGRPFLALEFVDGVPLDTYLKERALTLRQRIELFLPIARAIAFAHARLIVHRDLKPSNVLVTLAGEVRLLDFGIARLLEPDLAQPNQHTQVGARALTPSHAAPEQFTGQQITVATDVYSLGVILYELLTGVSPYASAAHTRATLAEAVLLNEPPLASNVVTDRERRHALRGDLEQILAKALRKSPAHRYETVNALVEDIELHLSGRPVSARCGSRWYILQKFARRNAFALGASMAIGVAVVVALGVAVVQWREAGTQRAAAIDRLTQAEAALNFTTAVLTEGIQQGESVSLEDLLQRSEGIAERMGRHDATTRNIATEFLAARYITHGVYEKAERILTRTIDSFPAGTHSPARSRHLCDRALALSNRGRADEAIATLSAEIDRNKDDPATAAFCLFRRAMVARQLNHAQSALDFALAAQRRYDQAGGQSSQFKSELLAEIGFAHALNGSADLAQGYYEHSLALLKANGRHETTAALATLNNSAVARFATGDTLHALVQLNESAAISKRSSRVAELPAWLIGNQAVAMYTLGRHDEARAAYELMQQIAERNDDHFNLAMALSGKAEIAGKLGRFDEAQALLDQSAAAIETGNVPADSTSAIRQRLIQSEIWAAQGRSKEAATEIAAALATFKRLGCCIGVQARVLTLRARMELADLHLPEASIDAERALDLARSAQGRTPYSSFTGQALLVLAQIRTAQGRLSDAAKIYASAAPHLARTLGDQHPDTLRARRGAIEAQKDDS